MISNSLLRATLGLLFTFGLFSADAAAQFGGRAGPPPGPPPRMGIAPPRVGIAPMPGGFAPPQFGFAPPSIMAAPYGRQSALPLVAPPISPIMNRFQPVFPTFGGFGYYPNYNYGQPYVIVNNNYVNYPPENNYSPPRIQFEIPAPPEAHPTIARLSLTAPRSAEVFINDKKMEFTGSQSFDSPELKPGESFKFDVRVAWNENGKSFEMKRVLEVKAGEHQSLQYR